ncbi:ferredoxin [Micromonospora sp. CPCC 206061]|uniref:ferredoxin n=1 Tax=Micromonospora sp. CPCC 206061 TaxID=3122410 RepID=UPI002FF216A9
MRVEVDFDLCESNAMCASVAPEVFRVGDDDMLHVLTKEPERRLWPDVEAAARACPKLAITLVDD